MKIERAQTYERCVLDVRDGRDDQRFHVLVEFHRKVAGIGNHGNNDAQIWEGEIWCRLLGNYKSKFLVLILTYQSAGNGVE